MKSDSFLIVQDDAEPILGSYTVQSGYMCVRIPGRRSEYGRLECSGGIAESICLLLNGEFPMNSIRLRDRPFPK
jgi:hypothetical protein